MDTRAFYAAKTASDGFERYAFGWLHTRTGEQDSGEAQWGGQLVVHRVTVDAAGTVQVSPPAAMLQGWSEPIPLTLGAEIGEWAQRAEITGSAGDGYAWTSLGKMPPVCMIEATLTFDEHVRDFGLVLRSDAAGERYYRIRLEPARQRVVFDRYPRPGEEAFVAERPVALAAGRPVHVRVFADRSAFVIYVDDRVALSWRGYDHIRGAVGLFVTGGTGTFTDVSVRTPERP